MIIVLIIIKCNFICTPLFLYSACYDSCFSLDQQHQYLHSLSQNLCEHFSNGRAEPFSLHRCDLTAQTGGHRGRIQRDVLDSTLASPICLPTGSYHLFHRTWPRKFEFTNSGSKNMTFPCLLLGKQGKPVPNLGATFLSFMVETIF